MNGIDINKNVNTLSIFCRDCKLESVFILLSYQFIFVGELGATLARHRNKSRVYIGCMKGGPVLAQK